MLIYKIFRSDEWAAFQSEGETLGAPIDLQDGFIHFSTADQVAETAAKHFAKVEGLTLVACRARLLSDKLKWEVSRNDDLFPHFYSILKTADVVWAKDLPCRNGSHIFPKEMV
jgi:uncharacterized protein (DUF952 family)